jgi:hypothetical protein
MRRLTDEMRELLRATIGQPRRRGEMQQLGLRDHDLRRLLRSKTLQRVHQQYVDGELEARLATIICAQAAHPRSVISHFTAAELTELRTWADIKRDDCPPTKATWLTCVPGKRRRNQKSEDVVLRRAGLTAADLQRHRGLLLTTDARTVVDLARELPLREAIVTVDHALRVATSRADLQLVLDRQFGWPGIQRARTAIAFGDPRSESALESIARLSFAAAGLPEPILQAQFWDGEQWLPERTDFWFPQFRTVVEADGLAKYDAATVSERRRLLRQSFVRDQRLADRDVEIIHFGWEDAVLTPTKLSQRMQAAFARGERRTGDQPAWRTTDPNDPKLWPQLAGDPYDFEYEYEFSDL